ncbi:MAG: hypothetical protein IT458_04195 [Planctomycetes bacterium]|nr:hypothetical protein [Planctomycetota bacterium]
MNSPTFGQTAALGALGLALVLALAQGEFRAPAAQTGTIAWAAEVERGMDHIAATELAGLLARGGDRVPLLVDVRPAAEYQAFHLPGAVNLDLPGLLGEPGRALLAAHAGREIVLYSNGPGHPGQAWVALRARGHDRVRVLDGGLDSFVAEVLTPASLRGVGDEARAAAENAALDALRAALFPAWRTQEAAAARPQGQPATKPAAVPAKAARYATDPPRLERPTVVSTAWVEARTKELVLLDAREEAEAFAKGHLPGARHVSTAALRTTLRGVADMQKEPEDLAALFGNLGIDEDSEVVVYGGDRLQDPAHLAIALLRIGHQRIGLMEGGFPAWVAERRPVSTATTTPAPRQYRARPVPDAFAADLAAVAKASRDGGRKILDVRPKAQFTGESEKTEVRAGHIPGSLNRELAADQVKGESGIYWRAKDELLAEYARLGLLPDTPVVVTCRTGHQAAQTWFLLRYLLGYRDVHWYDGSWKEWAQTKDLPLETGPTAGR